MTAEEFWQMISFPAMDADTSRLSGGDLKCPYCEKDGLTNRGLAIHVSGTHKDRKPLTKRETRRLHRKEKQKEAMIKGCEGKVRHELKSAAEREALRIGSKYEAYPCGYCKGWHVGRR